MKSIEEIKKYVSSNKSLLKHDPAKAFEFELYTFLPYEELPERYKKTLASVRVTEEQWGKTLDLDLTEAAVLSDIKDELETLFAIVEAPNNACLCRVPRTLALLWVYGVPEKTIRTMDRHVGEALNLGNPSPKVIRRLLNKIKDILN